jgi:serine/threonine protein kinase
MLAGRYLLGPRVGRGGMGDVYAAEDQVLHRPVAVKLFRFDAPAAELRQRVDIEIRTLAGLRHPGLVTVFDAGTVAEHAGEAAPFIVMELISGPTLAQRLNEGPFPAGHVALLGAELAGTLAYVHGQAVVHRDIKPANILLDSGEGRGGPFTAKLTDFGIARLLESARMTMTGTTVGTVNYLSPEQATASPTGPPSDVYSLGLVLLECLTGQVAFPGSGLVAAAARLHTQPPIPAWLPSQWQQLLAAMTALNPVARPTAADTARQLAPLAATVAPDAVATAPASASPTAATAMLGSPVPFGGPVAGTALLDPVPAVTPAPRRQGLAGRLRGWGRWTWAAVAAAVLIVVILLATTLTGTSTRSGTSGTTQNPAPRYPTVPGRVGQDLTTLERAVG